MDPIVLNTGEQQIISAEQAWHYAIIPKEAGENWSFYIDANKYYQEVNEELEILFDRKIRLIKADSESISYALNSYYRKGNVNNGGIGNQKVEVLKGSNKDFLDKLIEEAFELDASDIHIEIYDEKARVRFRIDGKLIEKYILPKSDYPALINKVKIKANMDIAEKRLPQDGRIFFKAKNDNFDIRVSSLPSLHGEKIVLRILRKDVSQFELKKLGFSERQKEDYLLSLKKTKGIILISGPTGSGKTTTLYSTLMGLNSKEVNILTIEDPIEYTLDGVNQVQLKESIGLSFAHALRTFLRQDPDIIMLGEIRDAETAQMAIRAALTGHLVLSTVHTNSAWGSISRLKDMGVPEFLLADTVNVSIAQRLVRTLCSNCKKKLELTASSESLFSSYQIYESFEAVGCENCYYTGYKGRTAIFEILPMTQPLARKLRNFELDISSYLIENKISTLAESALKLVRAGSTSFDEVYPILLNE